MTNGAYIVLEGAEGVGKTTQLQALERRLRDQGYAVRVLREPDSQSDISARAIRRLTQDPRYPLNTVSEVLLYNAARAQSLQVIKNSVEHGVICLVDRNYLTTLAIQYYGRGDVKDYETINRIIGFAVHGVEPDLCIVLDAPVAELVEPLAKRRGGERFDKPDAAFLERVRAGYLWEANQRGYPVVHVSPDGQSTSETIWKLVNARLKQPTRIGAGDTATTQPHAPSASDTAPTETEPPIASDGSTPAGMSYMALAKSMSQQLGVSKNQPIILDAPQNGDDWFYIPATLTDIARQQYTEAMQVLRQSYEHLHHHVSAYLRKVDATLSDKEAYKLAHAASQHVLPLATLTAARTQATPIGAEEKRVMDGSENTAIQSIAAEMLPLNHTGQGEAVTLVSFWPRNEVDLLPRILYQFSDQPLERIEQEVSQWPYEKKAATLRTYAMSQLAKPSFGPNVLNDACSRWDLVSDTPTFFALAGFGSELAQQPVSPRLGYDIPELIEPAGLSDIYESCFDLSLQLFSQLQSSGCTVEAQYAVLLGHRFRWSVQLSLQAAFAFINSSEASADSLQRSMAEVLAERYPILTSLFAPSEPTTTEQS